MALEMKNTCERCQARLDPPGDAYICSFECTFCPACAKALGGTCPNCRGEIVRRPRRKATPPIERLDDGPAEAATMITQCRVAS